MINVQRSVAVRMKAFAFTGQNGIQLIMMAVLTRATLLGDLSPFSTAWFAAGLFSGKSSIWMLIGCLLGSPWEAMGLHAVYAVIGCLISLAGFSTLRITGIYDSLSEPDRRSILSGRDSWMAVTAALGGMVAPLVLSAGDPYALFLALINGLLSLAIAPVLSCAFFITKKRTMLLPEEKLSICVIIIAVLLGIMRSPFSFLALPTAALFTLIGSTAGVGLGSAVGILCACSLSFSGSDPMIGASLGLMGFLSGAVGSLGRGWACVAFVLVNAVTMVFGTGVEYGTLHPLSALLIAILYGILPEALLNKFVGLTLQAPGQIDVNALAVRLRQSSAKRIHALSTVFSELCQSYGESSSGPNEQALIQQMRLVLCAGCPGYAACWNGTDTSAGRMLCSLLGSALCGDVLTESGTTSVELSRICRRAAQIPKRLGGLLREFFTRRHTNLERLAATQSIARQFTQAGRILSDVGDNLTAPVMIDDALSRIAWAALERDGLMLSNVLAMDAGALEVSASLSEGLWSAADAHGAAQSLSRALGIPMKPTMPENAPPVHAVMRFVQAARFSAIVGYASKPCQDGDPCGDSHLAAGLTGGRILLALSDGMGTGEPAHGQSEKTIRLIRQFLLAEIDRDLMLDTINQLLLLRGAPESFATADLCVLDLQNGFAEFLKLGACASFILRKGECLRMEGGRLPLGILDQVTPVKGQMPLKLGDVVVLITDGIADTISDEQSAWLTTQLLALKNEPPATLCATLLSAAANRSNIKKDDMTILAAKITRA